MHERARETEAAKVGESRGNLNHGRRDRVGCRELRKRKSKNDGAVGEGLRPSKRKEILVQTTTEKMNKRLQQY